MRMRFQGLSLIPHICLAQETAFFASLHYMIQRIQSVYLLLAIISLGLMSLWPIAKTGTAVIQVSGPVPAQGHGLEPLIGFFYDYGRLLVMLLALVTIFLFKDRKKQMLLGRLNYILLLAFVVWIQLDLGQFNEQIGKDTLSYGVSTFLPVVALALLILANRGIKKDEELVKSLDRLR